MAENNDRVLRFPEFKYVDFAKKAWSNRNNVIEINHVDDRTKDGLQAFRTIHRFPKEYDEHVKKTGSVTRYEGPSYSDFIVFDFDSEGEPEKALENGRQFVNLLGETYSVDSKCILYYFSGFKGYHIFLPIELFGDVKPSKKLYAIVKEVALFLGKSEQMDGSIYDQNRLLRLPNTRHKKSMLFKIQLTSDEFRNLNSEEIQNFAKCPRKLLHLKLPVPIDSLVELYKQTEKRISAHKTIWSRSVNGLIGDKIPKGERNRSLFNIAKTLVHGNVAIDEETLAAILLGVNQEKCDNSIDPVGDDEIRRIAKNALRYVSDDTAGKIESLHLTDSGNGELIVLLYGDQLRFDHNRGKWLYWSGHTWTVDNDGYTKRMARMAARARLQVAFDITDDEKRKKVVSWAFGSENKYRIDTGLEMAATMHPVATTWNQFNTDPMLLGCNNGVIDLGTGILREGKPEDLISMSTGIDFNDSAKCPRWIRFMDEIFEGDGERIDYIQRLFGYSLTSSTKEQILVILYGFGANGKTVLVNTLRHVLGDYAATASYTTFESTKYDGSKIGNDVAALAGKRTVIVSEVKENAVWNEARLKSLTGNDAIKCRFLYKEAFEYKPAYKIWFCVNHKPTVRDTSIAFWRRIRLIPLNRQFDEEIADKNLETKLIDEASGILNWAIEGCLKWQKTGLKPPKIVKDATNEYKTEINIVEQFLDECTMRADDKKVEAWILYETYQDWCKRFGEYQMKQTMFGTKLREMGYQKKQSGPKNRTTYFGIGLKDFRTTDSETKLGESDNDISKAEEQILNSLEKKLGEVR